MTAPGPGRRLSAPRVVLPLAVFLAGLPLFDMVGEMVLALSGGTSGPGGLLAGELPVPQDAWVTITAFGWLPGPNMILLTGFVLSLAVTLFGAALAGAARFGALALLLAMALPLVAWSPAALGVIGGQAILLLLDRGGRRSEALHQIVRLIGMLLVLLLTWPALPALVVSLIAVALAPSAMLTVSRPTSQPAPAAVPASERSTGETAPVRPAEAPEDTGPVASAPGHLAPAETPDAGFEALEPSPDPAHPTLVEFAPEPEPEPMPEPDGPQAPRPGPFGHDPVAALAQLTPAPDLVEAARAALGDGGTALLVMARLDGLAGIAEHLGVEGGAALFAEATARLECALPPGGLLSWLGDETFAALLPAGSWSDPDALVAALAAPFAAEMHVDGRAVSMEDALHVDVLALDTETLIELIRWADAAPG
jgi:GGDEF domain-containing protein